MKQTLGKRTKAVHGGVRRSQYGETSEAIFLTQGFVYDDAEQAEARFIKAEEDEFVYARYGNPTVRMFECRMAELEGTEDAFATASGMAAVSASLFSLVKSGDRVVSSRSLFGSCLYVLEEVLPKFGVQVCFVDGTDKDQWISAINDETSVVFLECLSNPTLEVIDLQFVCDLASKFGAVVIADNALATPVFFPASKWGADVVVYSATKHTDGQGRCLGGIILGTQEYIRATLEPFLKHTGGAISPFNAWVMLKGLETIQLRCEAQADAAERISTELSNHEKLVRTIYPHSPDHPQFETAKRLMSRGGTVFSLDLVGGRDEAFRFLNALNIIKISNNFGDAKSIVTHPATTTHQRLSEDQRRTLGITDGLVRISAGLEDVDDLLDDIDQALSNV